MSNNARRTRRKGNTEKSKATKPQPQQSRVLRGEVQIMEDITYKREEYNLSWFKPAGSQPLIIQSMEERELTLVDAPSGTGKSSTIIWKALQELSAGYYKTIVLLKNPTEAGDDILGSLPGESEDKLAPHLNVMKGIFLDFMSKGKLESDIKNNKILLNIPNYLLGATFYNSLIIIEEAQTMSPNTIKLLTERCGEGSRVVIAGDSKQRYSVKKREDGFRDLINRVTGDYHGHRESKYDNVGYIRMETSNNMRSSLSRFITEIYE